MLLRIKKYPFLAVAFFFLNCSFEAQVANYISNGSFEDYNVCSMPAIIKRAKCWNSIDSISNGVVYFSECSGIANVPLNGNTYQYARTGLSYGGSTFYYPGGTVNQRAYLKNRLKAPLLSGEVYCVKFYINIMNTSTYGNNSFGIYFGDSQVDTITQCCTPLTFINPQVKNPLSNIITDTLGWTLITGTFTANGSEKYAVIGNFMANGSVDTLLLNPSLLPMVFTDVCVDDVSCIPLDLPAYAYASSNAYAIPGNTLYLGRQRDVGIDEACMWYKLPNTTTAIDTAAGTTITVAATTETYMVKQDICGVIKYDTVVVHPSGAGFSETSFANRKSYLYPNPNDGQLSVILAKSEPNVQISVVDLTGKIVHEENKITTHQPLNLTLNLEQGTYFLQIKFNDGTQDIHRLIVH